MANGFTNLGNTIQNNLQKVTEPLYDPYANRKKILYPGQEGGAVLKKVSSPPLSADGQTIDMSGELSGYANKGAFDNRVKSIPTQKNPIYTSDMDMSGVNGGTRNPTVVGEPTIGGGNATNPSATTPPPITPQAPITPPPPEIPPVVVPPPKQLSEYEKSYQTYLERSMNGESGAVDRARKGIERDTSMSGYALQQQVRDLAARQGITPGTAQYNELMRTAQDQSAEQRQKGIRNVNDMRLTQQKEGMNMFQEERAYNDLKKLNEDKDINAFKQNAPKRVQNQIDQAWIRAGGDINKFNEIYTNEIVNPDGSYRDAGASEAVNATRAALDEYASVNFFDEQGNPMSWDEAKKAGRLDDPAVVQAGQDYAKKKIDAKQQPIDDITDSSDKKTSARERIGKVLSGDLSFNELNIDEIKFMERAEVDKLVEDDKAPSIEKTYKNTDVNKQNMYNDFVNGTINPGDIIAKNGKLYRLTKVNTVRAGDSDGLGYGESSYDHRRQVYAEPVDGGSEIKLWESGKY